MISRGQDRKLPREALPDLPEAGARHVGGAATRRRAWKTSSSSSPSPLVILRIHVMEVPAAGKEKLFEELLRLNATDMVHGAYAVDGKNVIIIDTLEADTMDLEEFEASIDAIGLALAQHYRPLSQYRVKA